VNAIRRRSSGTLPMFEKPEKAAMDELLKQSSARGCVFLLHNRHDHRFAASFLDLLEGGLAEAVRVDSELLGELAVTENFDQLARALNQARLAEERLVDVGASGELLQVAEVDRDHVNRERAAETALGQAALDRSLTTLEVELADVAALASLLALLTATAGLANAGADAAAEALLEVTSTSGRRQMREDF
jgi:hypothetical protein